MVFIIDSYVRHVFEITFLEVLFTCIIFIRRFIWYETTFARCALHYYSHVLSNYLSANIRWPHGKHYNHNDLYCSVDRKSHGYWWLEIQLIHRWFEPDHNIHRRLNNIVILFIRFQLLHHDYDRTDSLCKLVIQIEPTIEIYLLHTVSTIFYHRSSKFS